MNKQNEKILENVKLKISISNFEKEKKKKMRKTSKNITKIAAVACLAIISITGVVFAENIGNFVKNLFGANTSDGVDIAVNNGYLAEIETEPQSADGIEINVDSLVMDDFNFAMNFNFKVDEKHNVDEFESIQIEDLKIVDETGKTVFVTHTHEDAMEYTGAYSFFANKRGEREFIVSLSATGNPEAFPKSKYLTVTFSKLKTGKLIYLNNIEQKQVSCYEGNWKFEVEVPEEFYKRESVVYRVKSCSDDKTVLTKAVLSNTAFKIALTTTTDKIDYELLHTSTPKSIYDKIALQKEYVENSKGEKFETAQRSDGDGGYSLSPDNVIEYYQTFNLTKYDATDNITVHIFTNKGEEIVIELERAQ